MGFVKNLVIHLLNEMFLIKRRLFFFICVCVSIFSCLFANCSRSSFLYSYDETVTTGETIGTYCSGLRGQLTKIQKVLKYFHHKYFWYTAIYFQQIVTGLLSMETSSECRPAIF